jgi:hypothetical protein
MGKNLLDLTSLPSLSGVAESCAHGKGEAQTGCKQDAIHPDVLAKSERDKKEQGSSIA